MSSYSLNTDPMEPENPPQATDVMLVAAALVLDTAAAGVVAALSEGGVRSILLKGPATAQALYGDGTPRPYSDVDLLVAPWEWGHAGEILRELGFRRAPDIVHFRPAHAEPWRRPLDGVAVDLHKDFVGVGRPAAEVWRQVARETEWLQVGECEFEVLSPPAAAFQLALHAAQHGVRTERPMRDLERALQRFSPEVWRAARLLAQRLDALPAFATGLRLHPAGRQLADQLGLANQTTPEVALRADTPLPVSRGLARLARTPGVRAKTALLARELFPTVEFMRIWAPLARRGRLGLLAAYAWRIPWLVWHGVPALRAWRRAKRKASGT
jgi:hypothetical protein